MAKPSNTEAVYIKKTIPHENLIRTIKDLTGKVLYEKIIKQSNIQMSNETLILKFERESIYSIYAQQYYLELKDIFINLNKNKNLEVRIEIANQF